MAKLHVLAAIVLAACDGSPPPPVAATTPEPAPATAPVDAAPVLEYLELDELGPDHRGRRVKVHGYVRRDTIERRPGTNAHRFGIARRGAALRVEYDGVLPDDFVEQREVIITGRLGDDGTTLVADEVLAKCPDDYEELKRAGG